MATPKSTKYDLSALDSISGDSSKGGGYSPLSPLVTDENVGITKEPQVTAPLRIGAKTIGNLPTSAGNTLYNIVHGIYSAGSGAVDEASKLLTPEGRKELLTRATIGLLKQASPQTPVDTSKTILETLHNTLKRYSPMAQTQGDYRSAPLYKQVTEDPVGTGMDVLSAKQLLSGGMTKALKEATSIPSDALNGVKELEAKRMLHTNNPENYQLPIGVAPTNKAQTVQSAINNNIPLSVGDVGGDVTALKAEAALPNASKTRETQQAAVKARAENLVGQYVPPQPTIDPNAIPTSVRGSVTSGKLNSEFNDSIRRSIPPTALGPGSPLGNYIKSDDLRLSATTPIAAKITSDPKIFNAYLQATAPENGRALLMKRAFDAAATGDPSLAGNVFNGKAFASKIANDAELWQSPALSGAPRNAEWKTAINQFSHQLEMMDRQPAVLRATNALQHDTASNVFNIMVGTGASSLTNSAFGRLRAATGAARLGVSIATQDMARLLSNPDAAWLMNNIAGKSVTNPAVAGLTKKLLRVAGTMNIPATVRAGDGTETKVGE